MHFNSDGTIEFLGKMSFLFLILMKVLSYVYTTSCRFSEVVDFQARWFGLGHSRRTTFSYASEQNPSHPRGEIFYCTSIFHEKTLCLCVIKFWDGFYTSVKLDKLAAPQSNSSCLEIDHFGETATGGIKLGQHFYQNY